MKIDFTVWQSFDRCPGWWRNFVITTCKGISGLSYDTDIRDKALTDGLAAYNAVMILEDDDDQEIDHLEFETEEDYLAFRIKWM